MVWRITDEQGNESGKVSHMIVPWTRGRGLDLGCGPWKAWPHFIGVDNFDEWSGLQGWAPEIRGDVTDLSMFADRSLDFVYSSHTLEHLDNPEKVLREWWRVIKMGGNLVLYLPHADLYPRMGQPGANPDHKSDFLPGDVVKMMERVGGWDLVWNQTRDKGTEYSFLQCYRKTKGNSHTVSYVDPATIGKPRCAVLRYGGLGDLLQAASLFPRLKEQGYHVTVHTTSDGREVIRHDPNVDAIWVQDRNQVPQGDRLRDFWKALGREYDKVINLSEGTEGILLALPDRRNYVMSKQARHLLMNGNYVEMLHAIAEVPYSRELLAQRFYPQEFETAWAKAQRARMGSKAVIMLCMQGSSVHKLWPHQAQFVLHLLQYSDCAVLLSGGADCQEVEFAIVQECAKAFLGISYEDSNEMKVEKLIDGLIDHFGKPRLFLTAGRWGIRQTLSFLPFASLVVGPETGVMSGAAILDIPKIVLLSHSTHENLTRDWRNVWAVATTEEAVSCWPCHRMHYGFEHCKKDEATWAAACMADISAGYVMNVMVRAFAFERARLEAAAKTEQGDGLQDVGGAEGDRRIDPELVQQQPGSGGDDPGGGTGLDLPAPEGPGDAIGADRVAVDQHGHGHPERGLQPTAASDVDGDLPLARGLEEAPPAGSS